MKCTIISNILLIGILIVFNTTYQVHGKTIHNITTPSFYIGEYIQNNSSYKSVLYLGEKRDFFLSEEFILSNGKISKWETTGKWYLIRNGSLIQLTNINGFHRVVNVGNEENLYIGGFIPNNNHFMVTLIKQKIDYFEFTISGILHVDNKNIMLEDYNNGISYSIFPENIIHAYINKYSLNKKMLHVSTNVSLIYSGKNKYNLYLKDIQHAQKKNKLDFSHSTYNCIHTITGVRWKIIYIGDDLIHVSHLNAHIFLDQYRKCKGVLDIFDGTQHVTGNYIIHNNQITLLANVANKDISSILQQVQCCKLVGEVLELWGNKKILALLER